jgi:hypothetical protein
MGNRRLQGVQNDQAKTAGLDTVEVGREFGDGPQITPHVLDEHLVGTVVEGNAPGLGHLGNPPASVKQRFREFWPADLGAEPIPRVWSRAPLVLSNTESPLPDGRVTEILAGKRGKSETPILLILGTGR